MSSVGVIHSTFPVVANELLARDTYRLRLQAPELARRIRPGQFIMLRMPGLTDPLLGRAFALYQTAGECVEVVYLVVGKMTGLMARLQTDDLVEVWGPLGNGFPSYQEVDYLVLVAGGIGQTPFLALIQQFVANRGKRSPPILYYGARSADYLACVDEFKSAGATVHLATDDGSTGFKGFVTQLLEQHLDKELLGVKPQLVGCGPEPMLHALASLAAKRNLACDVSLETPMACGVGICFSCVAPVKTEDGWDYRRTCMDGPVFDASKLVWPA